MRPSQTTKWAVAALTLVMATTLGLTVNAQTTKKFRLVNNEWVEVIDKNESAEPVNYPMDEWPKDLEPDTTINVASRVYPGYYYMPTIFDGYTVGLQHNTLANTPELPSEGDPMGWVNEEVNRINSFRSFKQQYMIDHPGMVTYNINTLPEAPKQFIAVVDPTKATITIEEISIDKSEVKGDVAPVEVKRINWFHNFEGMVQFSQAYISPNWYQGGNNNLNAIVNAKYDIKLNPTFHPNLLFENTVQYKLALNSAPDDSLRNYSISEDLLQWNAKFGIRAAKRWYYSATMQFKTQLLNNYKTNTTDLKASFLSPGELNIGLGMTYEYVSPSKKFSVNASVAPLSYNLKICTNKNIDETLFGIEKGHTTASQYGSNIDCKLVWQMSYNINLTSRLTAFTDYSYIQSDWENTLSFTINKYLSTQIYAHLRYDTQTPYVADSRWHKLQLKEILSFGFAYKIGRV